jgi:hypothetical protein
VPNPRCRLRRRKKPRRRSRIGSTIGRPTTEFPDAKIPIARLQLQYSWARARRVVLTRRSAVIPAPIGLYQFV